MEILVLQLCIDNGFVMKIQFETHKTILLRFAFFIFALFYLVFYYQDVLYHIGWRNYFVDNDPFRELTVHQSSGWLIYISLFLNQIFIYPVPAAIVCSVLLTLISIWVEKLSGVTNSFAVFNFLPSFFLLLLIGRSGMAIFSNFQMATYSALFLGTIFALLLYAIYKWKPVPSIARIVSCIALQAIPVMGCFSILVILMVCVEGLKSKKYDCLLFLLLSPLVVYLSGYMLYDENYSHSLYMPFPDPFFGDLFLCAVLLFVSLALLPIIPMVSRKRINANETVVSVSLFLSTMFAVFFASYRDPNYKTLIHLSRMSENMEWKQMEKVASNIDHPTKGIDAYRIISAFALDRLDDKLFDVRLPYSLLYSPYMREEVIYQVDEFFYSSLLAMSQNLAMDTWVETGESYRGLKQFVIISLLRQEDDLALRYIRLMKDAPVLRGLACDLERYVGNRELLFRDYPIYKKIAEYIPSEDHPQIVDAHLSSFYLIYGNVEICNIPRRILASLYQHNIDRALDEYVYFRKNGWKGTSPKALTEAIVIKSILENNMATVEKMKIDPLLVYKVKACFNEFSKNEKDIYQASEMMYPKYKGMYCFYYLFDNYKFNDSVSNENHK